MLDDGQSILCARIAHTLAAAPIHDHLGYEALAYLKLPGPDYRSVLRILHMAKPKLYVEIGVRDGASLALAEPETRCIAIDPEPQLGYGARWANTKLVVATSDNFFSDEKQREAARGFDLALIDGDHSFNQAVRDFRNLEALAKPTSIIAIHDVIPMDERTATPVAETAFHTGDVWRLMAAIVAGRPDLVAFTVACPPTGLGIVTRFRGDTSMPRGWEEMPLDLSWDVLTKRLNIIPNDGPSIGQALMGEMAA